MMILTRFHPHFSSFTRTSTTTTMDWRPTYFSVRGKLKMCKFFMKLMQTLNVSEGPSLTETERPEPVVHVNRMHVFCGLMHNNLWCINCNYMASIAYTQFKENLARFTLQQALIVPGMIITVNLLPICKYIEYTIQHNIRRWTQPAIHCHKHV